MLSLLFLVGERQTVEFPRSRVFIKSLQRKRGKREKTSCNRDLSVVLYLSVHMR